jgi:hypothetical protein
MISKNNFEQTLYVLKQEIASIKERARTTFTEFEEVSRQAESLKVAFLLHRLEAQRKSLARIRGYESIMRNRKRLGFSLGAAAAGLIFGGIITKDKFAAVSTGLSSFDAIIQGLGETAWAMSLGRELIVVAEDQITPDKIWVTWESMKNALVQLEKKTSQGVGLGTLNNVISRLQKCRELVYFGLSETKPIQLERREP